MRLSAGSESGEKSGLRGSWRLAGLARACNVVTMLELEVAAHTGRPVVASRNLKSERQTPSLTETQRATGAKFSTALGSSAIR